MIRLADVLRLLADGVLLLFAIGFLVGAIAGMRVMCGPRRGRGLARLDRWLNAEADRGDEILRRERSGAQWYPGEA